MKYKLEFDIEAIYKEDTRLELDVVVSGGRFEENPHSYLPYVELALTDLTELP